METRQTIKKPSNNHWSPYNCRANSFHKMLLVRGWGFKIKIKIKIPIQMSAVSTIEEGKIKRLNK